MTNISNLLKSCVVCNVVKLSGQIILTHLLHVEVPKSLSVKIRVVFNMLATVLVASCVSKPDIIACSGSDKSGCSVGVVADESIGAIKKTVLQKNRRFCCC